MSRRNAAVARDVLPDPVYGSKVVTKLINQVMLDGKRSIAQTIVYDALDTASSKLGVDQMSLFMLLFKIVYVTLSGSFSVLMYSYG